MIRIIATAGAAQLMLMGSVHGAAEGPADLPASPGRGITKDDFVSSILSANDFVSNTRAYESLYNNLLTNMLGNKGFDHLPKKYQERIATILKKDDELDVHGVTVVMVDHFVDDIKSWYGGVLKEYRFEEGIVNEIPKDFDQTILKEADALITTYGQQIKSFEDLTSKFKSDCFGALKNACAPNRNGAAPSRRKRMQERLIAKVPPPKPEPKQEEPEKVEPELSEALKMLYDCYDLFCVDKKAKHDDEMGAQKALYKIEEQDKYKADPKLYGNAIRFQVQWGICLDQGHKEKYSSNAKEAAAKVYKDIMEALEIKDY